MTRNGNLKLLKIALKFKWLHGRGSAAEHVLYFKCHRKYYNGSASENTDLVIFCDTCLQWDSHYNIF